MKLSNFEQFIDDVILKRGKMYFEDGHVDNIEEIDEGKFIVEVIGSDFYKVNISLDKNKSIIQSFCDCPYDLGDYCKHEVASFFALRENEGTILMSENKPNKRDLKAILSSLKKEELINIILDICEENPDIKKQLLYSHSPSDDIVASSKKLIKEYINRYKKRGFIYYDDVDEAMYGAELTFEKAQEYMERGDLETAISLCLVIIQTMIDMLQYCDDSGGWVDILINQCIDTISSTSTMQKEIPNELKDKLFTMLVKEAFNNRYDGWTDWRYELLNCAVLYCDKEEKRNKLEKKLNQYLEARKDSRSYKYDELEAKLFHLKLIQKFDGEKAALQFIHENLNIYEFREKAIEYYLQNKNYEKVIKLCKEGIQVDKGYLGLVDKWKEYELKAYEQLNNKEKQKELMLEFLFKNKFKYYAKLKGLYKPNEWNEKLQEILEKFENELNRPFYSSSTYLEILKAENLTEKMLQYCRKNLYSIQGLYPYLIETYKDEVIGMLINFMEMEAANARNRKEYKEVCKKIKQYKNVISIENASNLIERLKGKYVRRPAFVDELNKTKL